MITKPLPLNGTGLWMTPDLADSLKKQSDVARVHGALSSIVNILQNLVREARLSIGAHYATIRVALDEDWSQVILAVSRSEEKTDPDSPQASFDASTMDSLLFPIPRPLRMTQAEMVVHPAWKSFHTTANHHAPMRGLLAVPLMSRHGRNFGLIDLTDKLDGDFNIDDENRLQQLASVVSLAVENAWLFHSANEANAMPVQDNSLVSLGNEIGRTLEKGGDFRRTLQSCVNTVARHFSCALARLWVLQDGILELQASAGMSPHLDSMHAHVPVGHLRIGLIAQTHKPRLINAALDCLDEREKDWLERSGLTSFAGIPLLVDDELQGVIAIFDRKPLAMSILEMLVHVSQAIALHIKRHQAVEAPVLATTSPENAAPLAMPELEHAVITANLDGVITDWNPSAEKLFAYPRRDAIGRPVSVLFPPEKEGVALDWMEKIRQDLAVSQSEMMCVRKDGKHIDVCLSASPLRDSGGATIAAVFAAHDLAGVKRLEQQYRQAQKMEVFGQLAGGVAHDFNNLLTVILGYSELLIRRCTSGDPSRDLLKEIHKAGTRAETLTRQLLTFSRKHAFDAKVLDLNAVVSDTEKMLRRLIGEDILMTTIFAPKLKSVKIDAGQMQQVILNLAINARDAMPRGGRLTIETDNVVLDESYARNHANVRAGNYVMFAISDTGMGMNAATKARIFEPLFTTKGPGKGTGLGLTTVQSIVKQYGGHIEVYTELGRGTSFKVYLPQVNDTAAAGKVQSDMHHLPRGAETILLAEDEDCVRSLTRQVLEICGYTVLDAADGAEAVRLFEKNAEAVQLLISDVVMPNLDGRSLADHLLAIKPRLKILFLSGYPSEAVVRHGVVGTDVDFLQKPFTTSALAQKVRGILDQKDAAFPAY